MTRPSIPLTDVPLTADLVRGALDLERTEHGLLPHRLPAWARARIPDEQLAMAESQPSGVRLALRTAATVLELDGTLRWTGLEIVDRSGGGLFDTEGVVEFRAHHREGPRTGVLHERSRFVRVSGRWVYLDGVVGR